MEDRMFQNKLRFIVMEEPYLNKIKVLKKDKIILINL